MKKENNMKFENMKVAESLDQNFLIATYYMKSDKEPDLYDWVKLVAADQSAGTWTHVEGETPDVIEKYGAKVVGIYPMAGERACVARIAFPTANFPAYLPMIMQYTIIHHRNWIVNCKVAIWRFFLFFYTDIQVLAEYGAACG